MDAKILSKKDLLSLIVHEIKSPIGIIKWHTEMLLAGDYGDITEEQRNIFCEIQKENARTMRLVGEFLKISIIPDTAVHLDLQAVNISEAIEEILTEFHENISLMGHTIVKNYPNDLAIPADKLILHLGVRTLISNAIKYTPKNGNIIINAQSEGQEVIISVANNGVTIPPEEQIHLYEKKARTEHARSVDPNGTGLGLYLMKSITEESGGRTWFTSNPGEDTVFFVAYPVSGMIQKKN